MRTIALVTSLLLTPAAFAGDVTPDLINGAGNANGGFTIDRNNGVEVALRGKLRHNATGAPENTFPWDGINGYDFLPGVAPTQSFPNPVWSVEWSINTDWDGSSGLHLDDLTYALSMTSTAGSETPLFDPINGFNPNPDVQAVQWDHAIGDNTTGNGGGTRILDGVSDAAGYADLIANNNVAQNSWKPHWFADPFDPTVEGTYTYTLSAFDGSGNAVASTSIDIRVFEEPRDVTADAANIEDAINAQVDGDPVIQPGNPVFRLSTERVELGVQVIRDHATSVGCTIDGLKSGTYAAGEYTGMSMPDEGDGGVVAGNLVGGGKTWFGDVEDLGGNPEGVIGDSFARYNNQSQLIADAGGTRFEAGNFLRVVGTTGVWYSVSGDCPNQGVADAFTTWFSGGLDDLLPN